MSVVAGVVIAIIGVVVGYIANAMFAQRRVQSAKLQAQKLVLEAQAKEKEILLDAKDQALRLRTETEADNKEKRADLLRQEKRVAQKEETLDRKTESVESREESLTAKERDIEIKRDTVESLRQQQLDKLAITAQLTPEEAKAELIAKVESEVKVDIERRVREMEGQIRAEADVRAQKIMGMAIQRYAADVVSETVVSVVNLPNDEMKGRIIGKEGRNIRALEAATGVDLIIDDTPEAVILSSFDPIRREVARVSLGKLMLDGRIHPGRIEEIVAKSRQEVEQVIREAGERAAFDAGVHNLNLDIMKLLGRLRFRTSYGQNVLNHSVEVAHLCATMAAEMGANIQVCREGGLLHDIGKALDHEVEGPHAIIGADVCKRLGKGDKVVHTIAAHHGEVAQETIEDFIVAAGDAISAARPGARRETVSTYVKRLEALEEIANSFPGVERSYAVQAGRELRVAVKPEELDDLGALRVARDVAKRIEESLEYPGQIRVTVIREKRIVEIAK